MGDTRSLARGGGFNRLLLSALSQTKLAEAVDEDETSFRRFLGSNSPEALPYKGFRPDKLAVEGNNAKVNGIPIPLAVAYWTKEAASGNPTAARLLGACAVESIERRADKAFDVFSRIICPISTRVLRFSLHKQCA